MRRLCLYIAGCLAVMIALAAAAAADDAPAEKPAEKPAAEKPAEKGLEVAVSTASDETFGGKLGTLADGKLTLVGDPPRTIDLADVQRVEFGKVVASGSNLLWIGQDNHDLVQIGGAVGGNGIQDMHLRIGELKPLAIKQIVVVCRFKGQLRVWRLDTSQSPHWRLAIARAEMAVEADLYIEPGSVDAFGNAFEITVTYTDGTTTKSSTVASTHTSDQLQIARGSQPGKTSTDVVVPATRPEVFLADQALLHGDVLEMSGEKLKLKTLWKSEIQVPLLQVRGIWFANSDAPPGARAAFEKQLASPQADDTAFLLSPADKSLAQIAGNVSGIDDGKLNLKFEGADRSVVRERVLGLVFAAHPKTAASSQPFQMFIMTSGDVVAGYWRGLKDDQLEIETFWQDKLSVPATDMAEIRIRNGKLTYLSDLDPASVEEVGYFGRVIHWGRDQGFDGQPPALKGKKPAHSLAMHSRCVLTYAIDEQFETFKATLGFDDSAAGRGRAVCRVLVDGREQFSQGDLRSDQDPQAVEVSLRGAKQLALEVDFGEAEDQGDRVLWVEPRLFRAAAQ